MQLECLRQPGEILGGILYQQRPCWGCPRMSQRTLQGGLLTIIHGPRTKYNAF